MTAVSPLTAANEGAAAAEPLPDIGRGLFEITDRSLEYVETGGLTNSTGAKSRQAGVEVAEVAGALQTQFPGEWTTFAHSPEGQPYDFDFVFKSKPSATVLSKIDQLPARVRVRWGAPMSAQMLQTAQLAVLEQTRTLFPGHKPTVELALSPMNTVLGVFIGGDVPDPATMSAAEVSESLSRLVEVATGVDSLTVVAEFDPTIEPLLERVVLSGGRRITSCTSGFGAYRPDTGNYGIVTATHCPNPTTYSGTSTIQLNGGTVWQSGHDIRFNAITSPHTANAKFYVNSSGTEFTVSSVANPGTATSIAMYGSYGGRGTPANGSVTTTTNTCYTGEDPAGNQTNYCGGFRTNVVTVPGDSGGPCFDGGAARGVISVGNSTSTWCAAIQGLPGNVTVLQGS